MRTTKKFSALGAYIFAGGFTRGILDSDWFNVVGHFEEGPYGVKTARLNFPNLPIWVGFDSWDDPFRNVKLDLIYGNPPCAAWSRLNGKPTVSTGSWLRDPRVNCTRAHFQLLETRRPKVWIWESVDAAFTTGLDFVKELTIKANQLGYSVTHIRFDGQHVGLPHRRLRYFMVAHRIQLTDDIPFKKTLTAKEVLARVKYMSDDDRIHQPLPKSLIKTWKATPPGSPLQKVWDQLNPEDKRVIRVSSTGRQFTVGRPGFGKVKIDPARILPTVVGNNLIHYSEPRFLTIGEQKAVCGYPATWKLEGEGSDSSSRLDLFTRAVMPPVGEWIGNIVGWSLDAGQRIRKPGNRVLDLRDPYSIKTSEL